MAGALAARLGDPVGHSSALTALVAGIAAGAAVAAGVILIVGTGGVAAPFIAAGIAAAAAGGGLAGANIGAAMESITGAINTGSPDVFIEGPAAARAAVDTATCSGVLLVSHFTPLIAQGSDGVFINGMMAARKGDKLVCGASIARTCTTVFMGGGPVTAAGLTIDQDVPDWLMTTLQVVALVGTVVATGGAALAFGPWVAGGALVGSLALGKGGGWLGRKAGRYLGKAWGNEELGARIGETVGETAGGLLGGFLGGWVGGRLAPTRAPRSVPPVEEPEPITLRRPGGPDPANPDVFLQEKPNSCGVAAARQVIRAKTGKNIPEAELRQQSSKYGDGGYDPENGTEASLVTRQLRDNGVDASIPNQHATVDDLAYYTERGDPAIAGLKDPNHFVTVEKVRTKPDGSRELVIADPAEGRVVMSEQEFNQRFDGEAIAIDD